MKRAHMITKNVVDLDTVRYNSLAYMSPLPRALVRSWTLNIYTVEDLI